MSNPIETSPLTPPVDNHRDHIRGAIDAPVTLVEYGDFECPHCGAAYPVLEQILEEFSETVRLVYRHFPLASVHPHAQHAAEASEAAGVQNHFWEMHDTLFENQDALEDEELAAYAQALGLNLKQFVPELVGGTHAPRVRQDFLGGVRSGVNGTPAIFINGKRYLSAVHPQLLGDAIQEEAAQPRAETGRRPARRRR